MKTTYQNMKFAPPRKKRRGTYFKCETCGKEFYRMPSHIKGKNVRFCSMECYDKTGENNPFHNKKHSADSIQAMKEHPDRSKFGVGKDNPNFTRFGTDYESKTPFAIRTRLKEAKGCCERCGFDDIRILQVHHKDRNKKNNHLDNLEVICPNCHHLEHYLTQSGLYNSLKTVKADAS